MDATDWFFWIVFVFVVAYIFWPLVDGIIRMVLVRFRRQEREE